MSICFRTGIALIASSLSLTMSGCASSVEMGRSNPQVTQYGAMKPVMRQGQTQARFRLSDAIATPGAIGVGALEGLAGEITIVDGQVWVARPNKNTLRVSGPESIQTDQATLLTLAHVESWQSVSIDSKLEGAALESFIRHAADDYGLDTSKPFPFIIEGQLAHIDLHVINGYCPIATDPTTIDAQPWRLSNDQRVDAKIVGFYAPDAAGVMTHHGTSLHIHGVIRVNGEQLAGHVDRVVVEPGMTLRLPSE